MKIMRLLVFTVICFLSHEFTLFGQEVISNIHLKNGSVLVGNELSKDEHGNIYVDLNGQEVLILLDDIKYIENKEGSRLQEKLFVHRTSISYLNGSIGNGYGVHQTIFYRLNNYFSPGLGIGINNYLGEAGYNLYPLFMDFKMNLRNSSTLPYVSMVAGYSFALADSDLGQIKAEGGMLIAPRVGYVIQTSDVMVDLYGGLRFQKARYTYRIWEGEGVDALSFKRIELGLGLSF